MTGFSCSVICTAGLLVLVGMDAISHAHGEIHRHARRARLDWRKAANRWIQFWIVLKAGGVFLIAFGPFLFCIFEIATKIWSANIVA